jgi:hypothetical protein
MLMLYGLILQMYLSFSIFWRFVELKFLSSQLYSFCQCPVMLFDIIVCFVDFLYLYIFVISDFDPYYIIRSSIQQHLKLFLLVLLGLNILSLDNQRVISLFFNLILSFFMKGKPLCQEFICSSVSILYRRYFVYDSKILFFRIF